MINLKNLIMAGSLIIGSSVLPTIAGCATIKEIIEQDHVEGCDFLGDSIKQALSRPAMSFSYRDLIEDHTSFGIEDFHGSSASGFYAGTKNNYNYYLSTDHFKIEKNRAYFLNGYKLNEEMLEKRKEKTALGITLFRGKKQDLAMRLPIMNGTYFDKYVRDILENPKDRIHLIIVHSPKRKSHQNVILYNTKVIGLEDNIPYSWDINKSDPSLTINISNLIFEGSSGGTVYLTKSSGEILADLLGRPLPIGIVRKSIGNSNKQSIGEIELIVNRNKNAKSVEELDEEIKQYGGKMKIELILMPYIHTFLESENLSPETPAEPAIFISKIKNQS